MAKAENFYKLRNDAVINTFGIRLERQCEHLSYWLAANDTLDDFEQQVLEKALDRYFRLAASWNDEELKMHFISPIIAIADTNIEFVCKTYFERPLSGTLRGYHLNVIADCMVAQPKLAGDPDRPFFFLQEYKQSQRFGKTDPEGQMLAAMLLAQETNADGKPLYGCYVIEKNWYFTTLLGVSYCRSRQFDSTRMADLIQIVFILRKLKELILNR